MKHIIIFCLLLSLAGCATVKVVKKGVIPPSCPLCQHAVMALLWCRSLTGGKP